MIKQYEIRNYYKKKQKLCHKDTDIFIVYIIAEDIKVDIAQDVETRFYTSNYELKRRLPE